MINVLITGVSSGIGEATAASCIKKGYRVFGSVRSETHARECADKWGSNFVAVIMDVCNPESIQNAVKEVRRVLKGEKLHILVNNAGVVKAAPLELQNSIDIRDMFEVNVFGLIEVTKALLPLIKTPEANSVIKPRIINISSVAGAIGIPFLAGYVATKHAVEGLSESWRRELMPFGIDIVVVAPGNVITPIWNKAKEETVFEESAYKDTFKNFFNYSYEQSRKGMKPADIASVVMEIIASGRPKVRYAPVAQKFVNWYLPRVLSPRTFDSMLFKNLKMKKLPV